MRVQVISPAAAVFDGDAEAVVAPAIEGEVGILPRHAPYAALLGRGVLRVTTSGGQRRFRVAGGFLQVADDTVRVLAEQVEVLA